MSSPGAPRPPGQVAIATDLVEYLVLAIPGPHALAAVGGHLVDIVDSAAIRVLDLVVVTIGEHGEPEVVEIDSIEGLDEIVDVTMCPGVLLSQHDIELVSLVLQPGDCAVVLVAEDRWAEPLAAAARALGGEVRAGERIARDRVEAALDRAREHPVEERR